jgi:cytochrome c551/c552
MTSIYNSLYLKATILLFLAAFSTLVPLQPIMAQESLQEEDFFRILRVSAPEGVVLEVGGLAILPNGDLGISTRRGDVYIVENPTSQRPYFRKFASGLHEILGLAYKDGALYCAQRGELTKLMDTNKDGKADVYETIYSWPLSGHYHEYSFGPKVAPDGSFFVSGNVAFGDQEWWRGESRVPWRGWMMRIFEDGRMEPWATGLRSPAGLGMIDGELFYDDNQGDWMGSGAIFHLKKGAFVGHPAGLRWTGMPNSPVKLTTAQLYTLADPQQVKNAEGAYIKPENVVNSKFKTLYQLKKDIPELQVPAVWLPHGVLGVSNSEIIKIPEGTFGPFGGQLLVGDQGQSKIMRVFMEIVDGEYQGAAWDFRSGFQSGVLRMAWAKDGSLFVGETNRGWGSAGDANQGLQRLIWNNNVPFEMKAVRAMPDGFEIEFTKPVNQKSAEDIASYSVNSFIYKFHPVYGSPPVNNKKHSIKGVKVSSDGLKARIIVDALRPYYIHNITLDGVREKQTSYSLVHPTAYYTLNSIPEGQKLLLKDVSTRNSATLVKPAETKKATVKTTAGSKSPDNPNAKGAEKNNATKAVPTFAMVSPLLQKYTCNACHNPDKRQIGPSYKEVAKRGNSIEKIVQLIYNPQPQNWPGYSTEMPPMPQVPKEDARKIASWIKSLK